MWRHLRVIDDCRVKDSAIRTRRKRHQNSGNHENPQASGRIIWLGDNGKSFLIKSVLARLKIYLWAAIALIFIESEQKIARHKSGPCEMNWKSDREIESWLVRGW